MNRRRTAVATIAFLILCGALINRQRHISPAAVAIAPPSPSRTRVGEKVANPRPTASRSSGPSPSVDICEKGRVTIDSGDPAAAIHYIQQVTHDVGVRWVSRLQNSDDLRARVAGQLLEGKIGSVGSVQPVHDQARNEVVQLASGSTDPVVYALALSMCSGATTGDAGSACGQLSAQRWASLDPDNAAPWLLLAGIAKAHQDPAAEAEFFSRAASARKMDSYNDSILAFAMPDLPADATPLQRYGLSIGVIGVEAAMFLPQFSVAGRHCSFDAVQDSTVRQQCNALAELLTSKSTNLLDLSTGLAIGKRVGWPQERIKSLSIEQKALMQAINQQSAIDADTMWTCDTVTKGNVFMTSRSRLGEMGAARAALEQSGESTESLAGKYDRYWETVVQRSITLVQQSPPDPGS